MKGFIHYFKHEVLLPTASKDDIDELKTFALTFAMAIPLIFAGILPWLFSHIIPNWPFYVSLVLLFQYFFLAKTLYYPYRIWMFVGSILAWFNTKLILAIAFFVLILPLGLILRILGKLDYKTKGSSTLNSYWRKVDKAEQSRKARLKEPF